MIVIDVPRNEWMSANDRSHWAKKSRQTKALRRRARLLARGIQVETPALVVAEIGYPRNGRADPGNAAPTVKAILDGCVDAGVVPDDDSTHVIGPHYTRGEKTERPGWHRVTLRFQPMKEET